MEDEIDREIRQYFSVGYSYLEIITMLKLNLDIEISYRQLKRHTRRLGLKRRCDWDPAVVGAAIMAEVQGSGRNLGCRSMASRLRTKYGINLGRQKILQYQKIIDPEGVRARLSHKLSRREYFNKGPNFLIHIDGYDKIKKYGFGIHGAICGFSRRILWLKVAHSNNNPNVIASYFMEYVKDIKGVPRCIRMDAGTENIVVADMQKACRWFHDDEMSGMRSVIIGSSHTNQRIESWWRQLHERCIAAWKDIFCQMEEQGIFSTADHFHVQCVRFCFMQLIQQELTNVRTEWNTHYIRMQTREGTPCGKPDILYNHPELYGTYDNKFPVEEADCQFLDAYCNIPSVTGVDEELQSTILQTMRLYRKRMPETSNEACELLIWLLSQIV